MTNERDKNEGDGDIIWMSEFIPWSQPLPEFEFELVGDDPPVVAIRVGDERVCLEATDTSADYVRLRYRGPWPDGAGEPEEQP